MDANTLREVMGGAADYGALAAPMNRAMKAAGVTNAKRAAMWCAQIGHESGGLRYMEEIADGSAYEGRKDLGNTQAGDGKRFKGRGPIQLTGRANYRSFTRWTRSQGISDIDFEANPHLLSEPRWGFLAASYYWVFARADINQLSDAGDLVTVTRRINGGTNGLEDRRARYEKALTMGDRLLPEGGGEVAIFDVDMSSLFGFGGPRPTSGISRIVIHTTENKLGTPAENVANYQINSQSGSYHALVDSTGKRVQCNTPGWVTWSTGNNAGNYEGLNLSFVAYSAMSRADWLKQEKMLRAGATIVASWEKDFNIPNVKTDGTGRGLCGHGDLRRYGGTDHTDPGANFPWDVFIKFVAEAKTGTPAKPSEEDELMTAKDEIIAAVNRYTGDYIKGFVGPIGADVKDVRQQITGGRNAGEYPGWPQLGKNAEGKDLTAVDAIAALRADVAALTAAVKELKEQK